MRSLYMIRIEMRLKKKLSRVAVWNCVKYFSKKACKTPNYTRIHSTVLFRKCFFF